MIIKDGKDWQCPHCGALHGESISPFDVHVMCKGIEKHRGMHDKEFTCLACKKNFMITVRMEDPTFHYTTFLYEDQK